MSIAVAVKNVSKLFGSVLAVDDASFSTPKNSFVSIVGPSGCGKSTLLRIVAGLVDASKGQVLLNGRAVDGPIRDVGMVFQSPVLLPWRTTVDNILLVAEMGGLEKSRYRARAEELMAHAGLTGFERNRPFELSGGMQQRVAICRAMLLKPPLILMDEPFSALDVITRERMGFALLDLWEESRNNVIFITHSITEAILLSDIVIVMSPRPGRIKDIVEIDLPRPRKTATLRDPAFTDYAARLRDGIEGSEAEQAHA